jgi:hypothetical protein
MSEDWRVTVRLEEEGLSGRLLALLHAHEVDDEARHRLGERIAVSAAGGRLFLYADTEAAAREAEQVVSEIVKGDGLNAEFTLDRWHHAEEVWESAGVPLPSTPAETRSEHERLEEQEAAESRASGIAEWELRVEFASHAAAVEFARLLDERGFTHIVRRSLFLLVGAVNRDEADAVSEQLQNDLPPGATIHVEPGSGLSWERGSNRAFAVMGGLAS